MRNITLVEVIFIIMMLAILGASIYQILTTAEPITERNLWITGVFVIWIWMSHSDDKKRYKELEHLREVNLKLLEDNRELRNR